MDMSFDLAPIAGPYSGSNTFNPVTHVSFQTLVQALQTHETSPDDVAPVYPLGYIADPTDGQGFEVPVGLARALGLPGVGSDTDAIILNQNLQWTFGQDATDVLEYEILEGAMGRIGGLGIGITQPGGAWDPMDLFRFDGGHNRDFVSTDQTYISVDGQTLLHPYAVPYTNGAYNGADFADWSNTVFGDAFGPGGPAEPGVPSDIDL